MKSLMEILEVSFWDLSLDQQVVVITLFIGCIAAVCWASIFAARRLRERRRNSRQKLNNTVELAWQDGEGVQRTVVAQCVDRSSRGFRAELPCVLEAQTCVGFRIHGLNAAGTAVVRYCAPIGSGYAIGLEVDGVCAEAGVLPIRAEYGLEPEENRSTRDLNGRRADRA